MLAASAGDTIKIFDISDDAGDPCILQYTPTPGKKILQVKWNHTNLVVASAGEDNKISLWKVSGQSLGVVPQSGSDVVGNIDESILGICFNSKSSRYLCSGGTGKVVRVWDLQRQRCIKWLKGHTDSIAGITYNCKGECLASISYNGNLLLHNLASATRATELKDPHAQVLRVLDNSRTSRHVFVTSGDEGSVHLWDTTARSPKVSWTKQHSAPTTGVCFCPNNDKMIVSVGFDKKLYAFDSTSKKPAYCIPCEAPFTSLAFKDDGLTLAAGTCSGSVVFYDVRGGLHPFTILRAYGSSEEVTSLCWQRSNPALVDKTNCTDEAALLGHSGEDSILMPDPLPTSASLPHLNTSMTQPTYISGQIGTATGNGSPISIRGISAASHNLHPSSGEQTPCGNHLRVSGIMSRLYASHNDFTFKDDMSVFSPLVDVQPISSLSMDNCGDMDKQSVVDETHKKLWTPLPSGDSRRSNLIEEMKFEASLNFENKPVSKKDDTLSRYSSLWQDTPLSRCFKDDLTESATPPEAWGGDGPTTTFDFWPNKSRFAFSACMDSQEIISSSDFSRLQNSAASTVPTTPCYSMRSSTNSRSARLVGDEFLSSGSSSIISEPLPMHGMNNIASSVGLMTKAAQPNTEICGSALMGLPKKHMAYIETRASSGLSLDYTSAGDGVLPNVEPPKQKSFVSEKSEEQSGTDGDFTERRSSEKCSFVRTDNVVPSIASFPTSVNSQRSCTPILPQEDSGHQGPPSFAVQLVQHTIEECLGTVHKAIHEDVQNVHLELLRQFHIQQTEMSTLMHSVLSKQADLMKELQVLRRENQQMHQLL
ncbi:hypothetical protein SUGI_0882670 [Cryptomeria japonica]|nr:hypothetical protein SUGI_0882670 [Cryptomeria japonica]